MFLSYFLVFSAILLAFVLAIRFSFTSALASQMSARLDTLLAAGARSVHIENQRFSVRVAFSRTALLAAGQGLEWFDISGRLVANEGLTPSDHRLNGRSEDYMQIKTHLLRTRTAPIVSPQSDRIVGFVRASQDVTQTRADAWRLDEILILGGVCALAASLWGGRFLQVRSVKPIRASYERLQEFSANASHELRGPITAVRSNADAALRDCAGMREADRERFSLISHAAQQMSHLTEDLLLLARSEQPLEDDVFLVDLSGLVSEAAQLYRADFERSGITLERRMPAGIMVYGNPDQLRRVFANLLVNAVKYTPRGGRVEIEGSQQRGGATVHVRDTGIGIPEEHMDKLFDRFWRAESARTRSTGTGLGLPIARALARRHGGDVTATSAPGKGSDFVVTLPSHPARS
ncbi:MAG TPA: HAMP domain-containing sensor histidine kinase [Candidatus Baltobacteraceae bacterium]|nr:HAMP domain-containing sensor histidine kinase [Candidatus Baltobacteraceae bacterium]